MTLDESIKHAEEVAEEQEKAAKEWHENQVRKCELIRFAEMDYTHENECKKCAKENRQLAEWLKDYKRLLELSEDCVSREQALLALTGTNLGEKSADELIALFDKRMRALPPVTPKLPTSEDCVSRQMVKEGMIKYGFRAPDMTVTEFIEDELPPVIPTHGTCKECKYSSVHTISLDKIDEIRVCRIQFSKQIKDDYYCANYEKRGSENEVN